MENLKTKRLYRVSEGSMIGGVSAGLGEYLDIDPVVIRALFVALALLGGPGLILYLMLWIIMPEQESYDF
jgi:phage shock protein C